MPIQRVLNIDLESDKICTFLIDRKDREFDNGLVEAESIAQSEYVGIGKPKDLAYADSGNRSINLYTCIRRKYEILEVSTGMQVSLAETFIRITHPLFLSLYAFLLVKKGLDEQKKTLIKDAFDGYLLGRDEVDKVEERLVRKGVGVSDYQVFLSFKLTRTGDLVYEKRHDDEFIGHATQAAINEVREIEETESCLVPDLNLDVTGRVQEVDNVDFPDDGIKDFGNKISNAKDCNGVVPTSHKVGTLYQYPEWKLEWKMKKVKIGKCTILKIKLPVLHSRTTKRVLYAIVLSTKEAKEFLERLFINCMEKSVIVGGLLLLVTGGNFATALAAFKLSMKACLASKVPENIKRCLIPELAIVTERRRWKIVK